MPPERHSAFEGQFGCPCQVGRTGERRGPLITQTGRVQRVSDRRFLGERGRR